MTSYRPATPHDSSLSVSHEPNLANTDGCFIYEPLVPSHSHLPLLYPPPQQDFDPECNDAAVRAHIIVFRNDPFSVHDGVHGRPVAAATRVGPHLVPPTLHEFQLELSDQPQERYPEDSDPASGVPRSGSLVEIPTLSPVPLFHPLPQRQHVSNLERSASLEFTQYHDDGHPFTRVDRTPDIHESYGFPPSLAYPASQDDEGSMYAAESTVHNSPNDYQYSYNHSNGYSSSGAHDHDQSYNQSYPHSFFYSYSANAESPRFNLQVVTPDTTEVQYSLTVNPPVYPFKPSDVKYSPSVSPTILPDVAPYSRGFEQSDARGRLFDSPVSSRGQTVSPTPTPSIGSTLSFESTAWPPPRTLSRPATRVRHEGFTPFVPGGMSQTTKTRGKVHLCIVCNKNFQRPSTLNQHMSVHTGARPFYCPIPSCGRRFSVSSNMTRHLKIHNLPGTSKPRGPRKRRTRAKRALQERKNEPWCPESLRGMRNAKSLVSRPPYQIPEGAVALTLPLPPVRPRGLPGDENYEERDSFDQLDMTQSGALTPYHPNGWALRSRLPGPEPSRAEHEAYARAQYGFGGASAGFGAGNRRV